MKNGFGNVRKTACDISITDMNDNEKNTLFSVLIETQAECARKRLADNPSDEQALRNFGWWSFNLPKMKESFMKQGFDFVFSSAIYCKQEVK